MLGHVYLSLVRHSSPGSFLGGILSLILSKPAQEQQCKMRPHKDKKGCTFGLLERVQTLQSRSLLRQSLPGLGSPRGQTLELQNLL